MRIYLDTPRYFSSTGGSNRILRTVKQMLREIQS